MDFEIILPIKSKETFAEKGGIREINRLKKAYGGKNWRKRKGFAHIKINNQIVYAELHWYECHGIGMVEYKIKRLMI